MISRVSIALLVIALLALAGVQYHWIGQISVAERERLEISVRESSSRFATDFSGEIRSLINNLDIRGNREPDANQIASRYRNWAENSAYPGLLKALYLVRPMPGESSLFQVDLQEETLARVEWPANLSALRPFFRREPIFPERRGANTNRLFPSLESTSAVVIQLNGRPPGPQRGPGDGRRDGPFSGRGGFPPPPDERGESWVIAELDESVITKQIFPSLVRSDFPMSGDEDYRIAVVPRMEASLPVFSTGKLWTAEDLASPDHSVDLSLIAAPQGPPRGGERGGNPGGPPGPGFNQGPGPRGGGPVQAFSVGRGLRLLVKHESGSLEKAVANLRFRNLAISFGILVVLGLGAGMVIISGQRARNLGKLQMEFAAGVSHELRTPLAVIQSAAHNLRSGIVTDREGVEEYAEIVQKEARRLSGMVEQVLTYAETQSARKRYDLLPTDLNAVVDRVLQNLAIPMGDANATVENRIDPSLPSAMADEAAMTQCLQNILNNALKYGVSDGGVQIEIESDIDQTGGRVMIRIIDHGTGVPQADERHLFDAFHRGSNAATNTPGNGLGLHLVRKIMESQKGTVDYNRRPGGGACFTLAVPVAMKAL